MPEFEQEIYVSFQPQVTLGKLIKRNDSNKDEVLR